ncbi:hypothetical protein HYH03_005352 [Edaphochlamys debaryana]|uniref:Tyrosyl-DNA phosphodiesterase 1 n=1 Tax=Edaphochlamys debaryana TaxID=47281 RepID=A0A836C2C2_9CHLO|nr:hypothetical protein HYH03_005352 [Edaphochlamys debaryana]|eukprot:KAG2496528.1 hypothetical protein HYH03_005352 [Edaphochlamys debaryana]
MKLTFKGGAVFRLERGQTAVLGRRKPVLSWDDISISRQHVELALDPDGSALSLRVLGRSAVIVERQGDAGGHVWDVVAMADPGASCLLPLGAMRGKAAAAGAAGGATRFFVLGARDDTAVHLAPVAPAAAGDGSGSGSGAGLTAANGSAPGGGSSPGAAAEASAEAGLSAGAARTASESARGATTTTRSGPRSSAGDGMGNGVGIEDGDDDDVVVVGESPASKPPPAKRQRRSAEAEADRVPAAVAAARAAAAAAAVYGGGGDVPLIGLPAEDPPDSQPEAPPWDRDSPLQLQRVRGLSPRFNSGCLGARMGRLASGPLRLALVCNYMVDVGWLLSACPSLARAEQLLVFHGEAAKFEEPMRQQAALAGAPHVRLHRPPLPLQAGAGGGRGGGLGRGAGDGYGTHHSKLLLLTYTDRSGLRLAIHTANYIFADGNNKTQGVWVQDFPPKRPTPAAGSASSPGGASPTPSNGSAGAAGVPGSRFEADLLDYFRATHMPRDMAAAVEAAITAHDFSSARGWLVASVPGYHTGRAVHAWGHMRLRKLLNEHVALPPGFRGASAAAATHPAAAAAFASQAQPQPQPQPQPQSQPLRGAGLPGGGSQVTPSSTGRSERASGSAGAGAGAGAAGGSGAARAGARAAGASAGGRGEAAEAGAGAEVEGLVVQVSSMGSFDQRWLVDELGLSLGAHRRRPTPGQPPGPAGPLGGPGPPRPSGPPRSGPLPLSVVWPTVQEVRNSNEGWSAGTSIPGPAKNVAQPFMRQYYCAWGGELVGRQRAMPHIKTYARYRGQELAWVLCTSHNLSKAAWGELQKGGSQLMVRSYELGVLVTPASEAAYRSSPHFGFTCDHPAPADAAGGAGAGGADGSQPSGPGASPPQQGEAAPHVTLWTTEGITAQREAPLQPASQQTSASTLAAQSDAAAGGAAAPWHVPCVVPLPYALPPVPYMAADEPWTVDERHLGLDSLGRLCGEPASFYGLVEPDGD